MANCLPKTVGSTWVSHVGNELWPCMILPDDYVMPHDTLKDRPSAYAFRALVIGSLEIIWRMKRELHEFEPSKDYFANGASDNHVHGDIRIAAFRDAGNFHRLDYYLNLLVSEQTARQLAGLDTVPSIPRTTNPPRRLLTANSFNNAIEFSSSDTDDEIPPSRTTSSIARGNITVWIGKGEKQKGFVFTSAVAARYQFFNSSLDDDNHVRSPMLEAISPKAFETVEMYLNTEEYIPKLDRSGRFLLDAEGANDGAITSAYAFKVASTLGGLEDLQRLALKKLKLLNTPFPPSTLLMASQIIFRDSSLPLSITAPQVHHEIDTRTPSLLPPGPDLNLECRRFLLDEIVRRYYELMSTNGSLLELVLSDKQDVHRYVHSMLARDISP